MDTNLRRKARTALLGFLAITATIAPAQSPNIVWTRNAHTGPINGVAYSPDGKLIATASGDHLVKLWRAMDGMYVATVAQHYDGATCVAFSADGSLLASGGLDREIYFIRMSDLSTLFSNGGGGFVQGIAFSRDMSVLSAGLGYSTNELAMFRVSDGMYIYINKDHWGTVWSVAYSNDGNYLVTTGADSRVIVYAAANGNYLFDLYGHQNDVTAVQFSPDSTLIASGGEVDRSLILHSVAARTIFHSLPFEGFLHGVAFTPDGKYVAGCGEDYPKTGRITFFRVSDGAKMGSFTQNTAKNVPSIAYSPDGRFFAYGRDDGTLVEARNPGWVSKPPPPRKG